jgi:hypothetical protein
MIMGLTWEVVSAGHDRWGLDRTSKLVMPAACQNGAEPTDIKRYPGDEETGSHQESSS